jgi:hypothetical protein
MAQQINLFNPVFLKQKKYFSAVTMLQALGLLLGGILTFYAYEAYETRALVVAATETGNQLKTQSEQLVQFTRDYSPQGTSRLLADEVAHLTLRLKQGQDMLGVLRTGGLGNKDGFARYLSAFARQSVAGVWLTGFSIGGDETELVVNGRVLYPDLVPAYIRALNHEEVMRGRRVSELRLTAREHRDTAGVAAVDASAAAEPARYVDFSLIASRGAAAATAPTDTPATGAIPSMFDAVQGAKGAK